MFAKIQNSETAVAERLSVLGVAASLLLGTSGMAASLLCAIHCATVPLALTFLPLSGLGFLANDTVEWTLLGSTALFGFTSAAFGFHKHRAWRVFVFLAVGLVMILAGRAAESAGQESYVLLLFVGGLLMATANFMNARLCRSCCACECYVS